MRVVECTVRVIGRLAGELRGLMINIARYVVLCALSVALCATGMIQEIQSGLRTLSLLPDGSPKITPEMSKDVLAPVKCDKGGNVYFRVSGKSNELQEPIVKISADGKTRTSFDARRISGVPKDFFGSDFAVDSVGHVYQIILTPSFELLVIQYAPDGTQGSTFLLHDVLNPISLSITPSGDLLVAGGPLQMGRSESKAQLVIAVFDKSGQTKGPKHTFDIQSPFQARFSDDGRLYVLSGTDVHIFSETGESIKQFHLDPDDEALKLSGWVPSDGDLAAEFDTGSNPNEPFKGMVALFDAPTGNLKGRYKLSEAVRGGLACVSAKTVTFLTTQPDGHLSLLTAGKPQ